jgi:putative ABC transport system permease protein
VGLQEIDAGFAAGLRSPLVARADGYASDAAVWSAVTSSPRVSTGDPADAGFAVVSGTLLAPAGRTGGSSSFQLEGIARDASRFAPLELWVRDERGGNATRLTVIGVLDPRVSLPTGLYTGGSTLELLGAQPPQRVVYYLRSRPDAIPADLALGLNISFADRGLHATVQGEDVRQIQNVRTLLNELLQGFFAIGLVAGLTALGLVSLRAVAERRQQIGVLRAIGFRRRFVRLSFLLEIGLVAMLGIGLGQVLGLAFARRLVGYVSRQNPEILFSVPWPQVLTIGAGAFLAALLCSSLPLWQIGRISPVEAVRSE